MQQLKRLGNVARMEQTRTVKQRWAARLWNKYSRGLHIKTCNDNVEKLREEKGLTWRAIVNALNKKEWTKIAYIAEYHKQAFKMTILS